MTLLDTLSTLPISNRERVNIYKVSTQCQGKNCLLSHRKDLAPYLLDLDHIVPNRKYTTRNGKREEFSDMVKRYAWSTIILEIAKCRVLCKMCHAEHTHQQRKV